MWAVGEREASRLVPLFDGVYHALKGHAPGTPPKITFYPYVDTKCTIRVRDGRIHLRLSDHLQGAPDDALAGVMGMLLCRLWGWPERRVAAPLRAAYDAFVRAERAEEARGRSRQARGRKHLEPVGQHRSLVESFLRVSMEMDVVLPQPPRLGWSQRDSRRRFGHWDADHNAIIISQALDDPKVPEFVLDFVVYHELLHIVMPPTRGAGGRRIVHPPAFVAREREFPQWQEAEAWLQKLAKRRVARRR